MMCLVLLLLMVCLVAHCLFLPLTCHLILSRMSLDDLLGFPHPQIGMVFLLPLFRLLLILLLCLSLIFRLLLKSVSVKLCRMNFRLFRTITLETLFLVLLELSLLGSNGFTPSSYVLMVLSKDIKLVWWHSKISRNMGLIMRKHSLLWPR